MAQLKNTFSLSSSQIENFRSCPRKYWFSRYGSWEGWSPDADPRTRAIYRAKKLTNVYLWTGNRVHETIKTLLTTYSTTGELPGEDETLEKLREQLRADWRQSHDHPSEGPIAAETIRLIEHDDPEKAISDAKWRELTDRALASVSGFYRSKALAIILQHGPQNLIRKDDVLETLTLSVEGREIPVYVTIDALIRTPEGYLVLDWKTGKPKSDGHGDQLGLYALFVSEKYEAPPEAISFAPVYLAYEPQVLTPIGNDGPNTERVKSWLHESAQEILRRVADPDNGVADETFFEAIPSRFGCGGCAFRRLCPCGESGPGTKKPRAPRPNDLF